MSERELQIWSELIRVPMQLNIEPNETANEMSVSSRKGRTIARYVMRNEPKTCHFCNKSTLAPWHVHHLDGDETNNERENLVWAHMSCHRSDTMKQRWANGEFDYLRGKPLSDDHKKKQSKTLKAIFNTPEMKERQKRISLNRWQDPNYHSRLVESHKRRHANMTTEEHEAWRLSLREGWRKKKNE